MDNGSPLKQKLEKDSSPCPCDVCISVVKKEIAKVRKEFFKGVMSILNKEIERLERPSKSFGVMTRFEVENLISNLRKRMIEIGIKT